MTVQSAQSVTVEFTTRRFDTGASTNADSTPTGTLIVNGTDNAASVTVTNVTTGRYKAAVTLPTLAYGDICELAISATVNSVSDKAIVWRDTKDVIVSATGVGRADNRDGDAIPAAAQILAAGDIDGYAIEAALKLVLAACAGKSSGAGTGTEAIRAADDSKARITATVDSDGNRLAVTLDSTG